eukprot:2283354-Prymnesium_polylepis.2
MCQSPCARAGRCRSPSANPLLISDESATNQRRIKTNHTCGHLALVRVDDEVLPFKAGDYAVDGRVKVLRLHLRHVDTGSRGVTWGSHGLHMDMGSRGLHMGFT